MNFFLSALVVCTLPALVLSADSAAKKALVATCQKQFLKFDASSVGKAMDKIMERMCKNKETLETIMSNFDQICLQSASLKDYNPALKAYTDCNNCLKKSAGSTFTDEMKKVAKAFVNCLGPLYKTAQGKCGNDDAVRSFTNSEFTKAAVQKCVCAVKKQQTEKAFGCTYNNTQGLFKWADYKIVC